MTDSSGDNEPQGGAFMAARVPVETIHGNLTQNLIQITEDKLNLILHQHISQIETKNSWQTPLTLLIALITTLSTTKFTDAGLEAATWKAIFVIATVASVVWLLISFQKLVKAVSISDLIDKIKNQ